MPPSARPRLREVAPVGRQAHVDAGFETDPANVAALNALIDWTHARGMEFHITENTVWTRDGSTEEDQAATYAALVRTLLAHRGGGVVGWNAWQMRGTDTERPDRAGCLFDADGGAKPAYRAVRRELAAVRE